MRIKLKLIALLLVFVITASSAGVYATWIYADGMPSSIVHNIVTSLFPWVELDEEEMISVADKFEAILNNQIDLPEGITVNNVRYDNTFETLMAAFNDSDSINYRNDSYIGTMQDEGDDVEAIIGMFDEAFHAEQKENPHYNMMLKRENFDSNLTTGISFYMNGNNGWGGENEYRRGAEVVLYSTNVEITSEAINNGDYIPVHATVYTRQPKGQKQYNYNGRNYPVYHYIVNNGSPYGYEVEVYKNGSRYYRTDTGARANNVGTVYAVYDYTGSEWYKIGSYVGEAQAVYYSAGSDAHSFSTDTWHSTEDYGNGTYKTLSQCVSYTLANANPN